MMIITIIIIIIIIVDIIPKVIIIIIIIKKFLKHTFYYLFALMKLRHVISIFSKNQGHNKLSFMSLFQLILFYKAKTAAFCVQSIIKIK